MTSHVEMNSMEISTIDREPTRKQENDLARNDDLRSITANLIIDQSMITKIRIHGEFNSASIAVFVFID